MAFKEITRPALSLIFSLAFIIYTGIGLVPTEAFVGVATATIIWWFKSRDEEKRLEGLNKK